MPEMRSRERHREEGSGQRNEENRTEQASGAPPQLPQPKGMAARRRQDVLPWSRADKKANPQHTARAQLKAYIPEQRRVFQREHEHASGQRRQHKRTPLQRVPQHQQSGHQGRAQDRWRRTHEHSV